MPRSPLLRQWVLRGAGGTAAAERCLPGMSSKKEPMTGVKQLQRIVALGFCTCLTGPALAITDGVTAQGLRFVTGGITDDERDALGANSEPHGLKVVTVSRER